MKRFISLLILISFVFSSSSVFAEVLEGHAEKSDVYEQQLQKELFTGQVEHLERKDVINMTVSQVLDSNINIEGDEFFAEVTDEVKGDKGVIIPKGTIAHGRISQTGDPKRLGRQGWIALDFDYLITPDGREIPIEGKMSTKLHPVAEASKIVVQDVGYTLAGGAVGGFMALNWLGLEAAIASQGYTVAGGAAVGGAIGLGMALIRKGHDVLIAPGDEIRVKINTTVPLPVYKESALMQHEMFYPGLDIHISNIKHEKDPFGEVNTLTLTIMISNMSDKTFSGLDMALVNDYNSVFRPSIFGDTKLMFKQIRPGDKFAGQVSFSVDNINRSFWLTFYDRRKGTALTKISLDNAYRKVPEKTKKKNLKLRRQKTNFKKEEDLLDIQ
ncbi:putative PEGA domain protein [Clostridium sp. CAG:768]|nr:putative PEGA domain protein [Clostridium sp. CAG:768]